MTSTSLLTSYTNPFLSGLSVMFIIEDSNMEFSPLVGKCLFPVIKSEGAKSRLGFTKDVPRGVRSPSKSDMYMPSPMNTSTIIKNL